MNFYAEKFNFGAENGSNKIPFPSHFILWSKVEKQIENMENYVLKKYVIFGFYE